MTNPRKDYHKTYNTAKYKANPAHFQEVSREYYKNHPEEHKARVKASRKKRKNRKYWHELTDEERTDIISTSTVGFLMANYSQPDWCKYPEALGWTMGCWSLCDDETKVNYEFCKTCDCSKNYEKTT